MTNIEARIICHPPIPLADITPLETLVLTNALECSEQKRALSCSPISGRGIRSA
ncbi:hypothetical protein [Sinorhizobium meliloti]|uniref:hypothetical protein n=1 Tax=Rhizobium meliloti TaxID=382 RepID=UPI001F444D30|nr:hypothetical protein [Sinorhizobium meliloti]